MIPKKRAKIRIEKLIIKIDGVVVDIKAIKNNKKADKRTLRMSLKNNHPASENLKVLGLSLKRKYSERKSH